MRGFVLDVEGLPQRRMTIELTDKERRVHATTTSMKGEYTFSNLCPGPYTLASSDQQFRSDTDFFVGASKQFRTELRKHLKKLRKRTGSLA